MYAVGLAVAYLVLVRLARLAGEDPDVVGNGIIIVAVAALIGGRLYHVIDQWELYADDPISILLPPYSGLGVYGGIVTGFLAAWWYARRRRVPFARWIDIIAPALFVMQAIGRWGNYFNQELYGPPTSLPWGIPIDCAHRLAEYPCALYPEATTRFQPLFLYESISGLIGAAFLVWLGFAMRSRLRPGDLFLVFLIWYGTTRFVLETFRVENWTFYGIPVAQIFSVGAILAGVLGLAYRHRRGHASDRPATNPQVARWGALGAEWMSRPIDEPWANVPDMRSAAGGAGVAGATRLGRDHRRGRRRWRAGRKRCRVGEDADHDEGPDRMTEPDPADGADRPSGSRHPGHGTAASAAGRVAPEAMAAARGGVTEGLAWLGRPPEAKASLLYRAVRLLVRFLCFGVFRFRIATSGQDHVPPGGYLLVAGAHRGWMDPFVVMHALPVQPRCWILGSGPSALTSRWREWFARRIGGLLPVWRGGVGIGPHVASARAVLDNGAVFVQMPEGTVSGPPGRLGPMRTGWAIIAMRTGATILPLAMAGTEELYIGRRMGSRVLPPTTVREPGRRRARRAVARRGHARGAGPGEGHDRSAGDDPRPRRRGVASRDDRPARPPAAAAQSPDLAAPPSRPAGPRMRRDDRR